MPPLLPSSIGMFFLNTAWMVVHAFRFFFVFFFFFQSTTTTRRWSALFFFFFLVLLLHRMFLSLRQ